MIKEALRKWLEVPEAPNLNQYITKDVVREVVVEVVVEAFKDEDKYSSTSLFSSYDFNTIKGTIKRHTVNLVREQVSVAVAAKVSKIIKPEEFIDSIVQRIKSKQLGGQ